jgi:hypothetical protein
MGLKEEQSRKNTIITKKGRRKRVIHMDGSQC